MFIRVAPNDGPEVLINVNHILAVNQGSQGGALIVLTTERVVVCKISRDEVEALVLQSLDRNALKTAFELPRKKYNGQQ